MECWRQVLHTKCQLPLPGFFELHRRAGQLLPFTARDNHLLGRTAQARVRGRSAALPSLRRSLQQGLAQHVAVLDLLGVDLAVPAGEDALAHGRTFAFVSREELLASSDPLALTATLVRDTNLLALGLSDAQLAAIEEHSRRVEQATGIPRPCPRDVWAVQPGHPWTLGSLLGDWTELLGRLEPAATSEGARQQVQQMRELLRAQVAANHEVRAG